MKERNNMADLSEMMERLNAALLEMAKALSTFTLSPDKSFKAVIKNKCGSVITPARSKYQAKRIITVVGIKLAQKFLFGIPP